MRFELGCQAIKNSMNSMEQHVKNSMVKQLGRSRSDVFAGTLAHSPSRWRGAATLGTPFAHPFASIWTSNSHPFGSAHPRPRTGAA